MLNNTYRSELCLLYPPHLIATASIYLAFSLHFPPNLLNSAKGQPGAKPTTASTATRNADTGEPDAKRMRGSSFSAGQPGASGSGAGTATGLTPNIAFASMPSSPLSGDAPAIAPKPPLSTAPRGTTDPITFLASLNVQLPLVLEIVQEVLSLYACWKAYEEPPSSSSSNSSSAQNGGAEKADIPSGQSTPGTGMPLQSPTRLMQALNPALGGSFPGMGGRGVGGNQPGAGDDRALQILNRMRMNRDMDLAHPAHAGAGANAKPK